MTFEQTNEKQRQRMKADARSHKATARTILAGPLYARLKGGEDLYTVVWGVVGITRRHGIVEHDGGRGVPRMQDP